MIQDLIIIDWGGCNLYLYIYNTRFCNYRLWRVLFIVVYIYIYIHIISLRRRLTCDKFCYGDKVNTIRFRGCIQFIFYKIFFFLILKVYGYLF